MKDVSHMNLVEIRVSSLISSPSPEKHPWQYSQSFKPKGQVPKLEEKD